MALPLEGDRLHLGDPADGLLPECCFGFRIQVCSEPVLTIYLNFEKDYGKSIRF